MRFYVTVCAFIAAITVIINDIDPDTVINLDGEFYLLDMDNNSTNDFIIFKDSGVYSYEDYSSTSIRFREFIGAGPLSTFQNKLMAGHYYNSWNGAEYYLPYDLLVGELIGSGGQFYSNGVQVICAGHFINYYTAPAFDFGPGYWKDFDFEGVENRYLGVTFVDEDDNRYYGWVRCSTADSMKAITIHEYAFENIPNKPIIAGSNISYVDINTTNKDDITVWNFGSTIYYTNPVVHDGILQIINSMGAIIFETKINGLHGTFDLKSIPSGVYILKVEGLKKVYKIVI